MKILVISDIHANSDALKAVLDATSGLWEGFLCLGDITGYGPEPGICIDILRDIGEKTVFCHILAGNHDAVLSGQIPESWFNKAVLPSIKYTREHISSEMLGWLGVLPSHLRISVPEDPLPVLAVHGSPEEPLSGYLWGGPETLPALSYLADQNIGLCFAGHTHEVGVFSAGWTDRVRLPAPGDAYALRDVPVIVNPGSIGFPRSFNGSEEITTENFPAVYAIWDTVTRTVSFQETRYDRRAFEERYERMQ